ncbi:PREDICTED: gamma-aminobutyric acid type B receptor subunit 1-like [Amphimedon queenslandica]|uniref:Receptor ligand binding region domain-containing protein n=1 Tax=Amphimedon queenslandica TaxID=400682 RepID=A0AAN0INU6_AMPQE|nr:PREDICTED: gamma-aminobutyric acid type B receptor subunit 1-like [Amphimedon queenslandica]|eukprot:XP_011405947.2 PREDICTED: gamma-aminobutyric acid type B receptor subunit 1-like [Amphimedon queenslandica]
MSASMFWQQLLLLLFFNVARTQSSYLNCSIDTRYPLLFVGFFPCLNQWDEVGDCDRLALTAVERAIAEINQDTNILKCFEIKLLALKDLVQETTELIELLYNKHDGQPIHGVIGPYHTESAKMFAYIFGHYLSTLQVSYSVTSVLLDDNHRYPYFHTTIPNDEYFSVVISKLLDYFDWQRVAIISAFDEQSALVLQSLFRVLAHHNKHLHIFDSVKDLVSAKLVLKSTKAEDFRIFITVMDPIDARNLLCQAYRAGLTTANHVWILHGMNTPDWWTVNTTTHDCTSIEMNDAIGSVLFVDIQSSTFTNINQDKRNTISKILNNDGSLTETEFYSLLHSKVFNAYDAARILALTWNVTINNYTTEELHNLLNQSWKISNEERYNLVETLQYNLVNNISPYTGLAGVYDFSSDQSKLGSAIITQITGCMFILCMYSCMYLHVMYILAITIILL